MKPSLVPCITLAALAALATSSPLVPARADLRPPPRVQPQDKTPAEAKLWLQASVEAMKDKDMEQAAALCDPRGYGDNLVGGSGNPLESLFSQGARKGWHLVADHPQTRRLRGDQGAIVRAAVRDNETDKDLDEIYLLLIKTTDADGGTRWLALGAGEQLREVDALASRFLSGQPLAPTPAKPQPPDTE